MQTYEIIEIISFILTILGLIIKIISQHTKNEKLKKFQKVLEEMQVLCKEAETIKKSGGEKKDYVLMGIQYLCGKFKIDYEQDFWSKEIDNFISNTKSINYKK